MTKSRTLVWMLGLWLLAGGPPGPIAFEKDEKSASKEARGREQATKRSGGKQAKPDTGQDVPTFTTEDLERKYGPSRKAAHAKSEGADKAEIGTPQRDPLGDMESRKRAAKEREVQRADLQRQIGQLEQRVEELERRLAQLRNPLLGRAQPDGDETETWEAADQAQRLTMTEQKLEAVRLELGRARKELSGLGGKP